MLESDYFLVLPWALAGIQAIFVLLSLSFLSLHMGDFCVPLRGHQAEGRAGVGHRG